MIHRPAKALFADQPPPPALADATRPAQAGEATSAWFDTGTGKRSETKSASTFETVTTTLDQTARYCRASCFVVLGFLMLIPNEMAPEGSVGIGLASFAYAAWIANGRAHLWHTAMWLAPVAACMAVFG